MACSEIVQVFASIGFLAVYLTVGALVAWLIFKITREHESSVDDTLIILGGIFWPLALAVLVIIFIGRVAVNLIYGATLFDLRRTEDRLSREIRRVTPTNLSYGDDLDIFGETEACKFKIGDIVTGAKIQTDEDGDPKGYHTLYEGCFCRVIDPDDGTGDDDCMEVILIGHKDSKAHKDKVGDTFEVPPRNFVLLKENKAKKKAVKRPVRKAVRRTNKKKARR